MKTSSTPLLISATVFLICVTEWTEAQPSPFILVEPTSSMVHTGDPFQFVCKANSSITLCTIEMPQNRRLFSISTSNQNASHYFGSGLQAGECGARILKANPNLHHGLFTCIVRIQQKDVPLRVSGTSSVFVIPSDNTVPEVQVEQEEYFEGSLLNAVCTFRSATHATNPSWFLDDELITTEMPARPQPSENPITAFLARNTNIQKHLTRKVNWRDHGRKLRCVAQHFTGDHNHTSKEIEVHVLFAPRPMNNPDLIQRYLGDENFLFEYILRANPEPKVQWKINNVAISDLNLEYNDEVINLLQPGLWQAQLELKIPGKSVANNISMTAANLLGSQTYRFKTVQQNPDGLTDGMATDKLTDECEGHGVTAVVILSILLLLTIISFTAVIVLLKRKFNRREIELLHRLQEAHRRGQARESRVPELVPEPMQPLSEEYSYISVIQQEDRHAPGQGHESIIYQNTQNGTYVSDNENPNSPTYVNHPQNIVYVNQK